MTSRVAVYEHYSAAKQALSKGNAICEHADELSKQTESSLASAAAIALQIRFLRDALEDQLRILQSIASQIMKEEEQYKLQFTTALTDLDALDNDLNRILGRLRNTTVASNLNMPLSGSSDPPLGKTTNAKTLFDFADDSAIETLKGQLREVVDDMQENQGHLAQFGLEFDKIIAELEKAWDNLPASSTLPLTRTLPAIAAQKSAPHKSSPLSMSGVSKVYTKQQENHIHEMADLLLSLSKHYDHASKLLKSESSLPMEELEELYSIVEHDALQLEDVLLELDDRLGDLADDVALVKTHITESVNVQSTIIATFSKFEAVEVEKVSTNLVRLRQDRQDTNERLDALRDQLIGLADHYTAFGESYDALIMEVDRRSKYENTISSFLEQTRQTLAKLAQDEAVKRDNFIHDHGDSLPGDIWHGVRDRPVLHEITMSESIQKTPRLPESVISAAKSRLA